MASDETSGGTGDAAVAQAGGAAGDAAAARRAAILDAAGGLFVTEGFAATTTLAVARRARVSKRDLYRHFPTKQALLDALVVEHSRPMLLPPDLPRPTSRTELLTVLEAFGGRFLAAYLAPHRIAYLRLAIAEAPRTPALGRALLDNGVAPVRDSLMRLLDGAAARGLIAAGDVELIFDAFFLVLIGGWPLGLLLGSREPPTPADVAAQTARAIATVRRLIGEDADAA